MSDSRDNITGRSVSLQHENRGPFAPGDIINGSYKVEAFLGQGGMGFVYRVEHLAMSRQLALKVLRSDQVTETAWRRFQTEAQAIARLDHINIVKIYDMSHSENGLPYYTMDLLTGESLAELLSYLDILPLKQALPIFRQVCAGLAYAHERGIIHRDIKPANIMLLSQSNNVGGKIVKIVDFGIAKLTAIDGGAHQGVTRPGEVFGSPLYMSPEQCAGIAVDHRTDIYSVGVTFFEILTGSTPFAGNTAVETTMMHQSMEAPTLNSQVSGGNLQFPSELERIIAKLLQKSPEKRYQSLAETAADLLSLEHYINSASHSASSSTFDAPTPAFSRPAIARAIETTISSEDKKRHAEAENRMKIIGLALFLLLGAAAITAAFSFWPQPTAKKVVAKAPPASTGTAEALPAKSKYQAEIDNKTPFSTIVKKNGETFRHFEFPRDFSVGFLQYSHNNTLATTMARGPRDVPYHANVEITVSGDVTQYPTILKRFQHGDLKHLECKSIEANNEMVKNISQVTSIHKLELAGNDIDDGCLAAMSKLIELESLDIADTKITGQGMAKAPLIGHLVSLNFNADDKVSPLLDALRHSKKIERLYLDKTAVSAHDIESLSTMPNLETLTLSTNGLRDSDLAPLVKLKHLKSLDLRRNHQLTSASCPTFMQMPQLSKLYLSLADWSPTVKRKLQRALPHCSIKSISKAHWSPDGKNAD